MILKYIIPLAAALALLRTSTALSFSAASLRPVFSGVRNSPIQNAPQTLAFTRKAYRMVRSETKLFAKKKGNKRRRRKDGGNINKTKLQPKNSNNEAGINRDNDDLPDFELIEDIDLASDEAQLAAELMPIDMNDEAAVLNAMKVKNEIMPSRSTNDLLASRNFDLENSVLDNATEKFPSLAEYTGNPTIPQPVGGVKMGKKAARAAARRNAAIEAEKSDKSGAYSVIEYFESKFPNLPKLPFFSTIYDEKGNVSPFKIAENAAWAGIYALVIWEIYINSPFFNRQAGLAPFVFRDPP